MPSGTLPPLRGAGLTLKFNAAATTPTPFQADYTYTPPLKAYMAATHTALPRASHNTIATGAAGSSSQEFNAAVEATPQRTAASLQAKLQHAVRLDQLTSLAQSESTARAALRCTEAEARDDLWWRHQQQQARLTIDDEYTRRARCVETVRDAQQQLRWCAAVAELVEEEEPAARCSVEEEAAAAWRVLDISARTHVLQLSARDAAVEQHRVALVEQTAAEVRAAELDLAQRSYRPIPHFNPSLENLSLIAEGLCTADAKSEGPLDLWRRRHPTLLGASRNCSSTSAAAVVPYEGQSTLKTQEMYARRSLRYDAELDGLYLQWWIGAARIQHVDEVAARRRLFFLWSFAASPVRMRAVVVLQRWWRTRRVAVSWGQLTHARLAAALHALPQRHSSARCRRQLRALEKDLSGDVDTTTRKMDAAAGPWQGQREALTAAALHPRRYALMLDWYVYTLRHTAAAFCAGVSLSAFPAHDPTAESSSADSFLAPNFELALHSSDSDLATTVDAWRSKRWLPYSTLMDAALKACEAAEQRSRQTVLKEEQQLFRRMIDFACVLHRGSAALVQLHAAQLELSKEEAALRRRVCHQEQHERAVRCPTVATHANTISGSRRGLDTENSGVVGVVDAVQRKAKVSARSKSAGPGEKLPRSPTTSFSVSHDELNAARYAVQVAHTALHSVQQQQQRISTAACSAAERKDIVAPTPQMPTTAENAAQQYAQTFDAAAASVYAEQYTNVEERFRARNASLLHAIHSIVQEVLEGKTAIAEEESAARHMLWVDCYQDTAVQLAELAACEEHERQLLVAAHTRAFGLLGELYGLQAELIGWECNL